MAEDINYDRRLLSTAVMTIAAMALASLAAIKSWFACIGAPNATVAEDKSVVQQMTPAAVPLPIEGEMPSLGSATAWLNAPLLTAAVIAGKSVFRFSKDRLAQTSAIARPRRPGFRCSGSGSLLRPPAC